MNLTFSQSSVSFCSFFVSTLFFSSICLSHFYSNSILHLSSLRAPSSSPYFSCCRSSLILFLLNNNCWPSAVRGQAGEPAKLARASTLLLPSGWGSFNAPLESFQLRLHSSLHPSLFPHKTATKKAEEKSVKHIRV